LRDITLMENLLGELWFYKLTALAGVAYIIYVFIKDRMGK